MRVRVLQVLFLVGRHDDAMRAARLGLARVVGQQDSGGEADLRRVLGVVMAASKVRYEV